MLYTFADQGGKVIPAAELDANFAALLALVQTGGFSIPFPAAENIAAGAVINIFSNSGVMSIRNANAANGRQAQGFIVGAITTGLTAAVFFAGSITGLSGLSPGQAFLSDNTPGGVTSTPVTTPGEISQVVGQVTSPTSIVFLPQSPLGL